MKFHLAIVSVLLSGVMFFALKVSALEKGAAEKLAPQTGEIEEMMLSVGEQRVFDADNIDSFSESSRGIIEIKVPRDGKKMIVTAVRAGSTSLLLIDKSGGQRTLVITVFARLPEVVENELRDLFSKDQNLSFRRAGPRVFVDGIADTEGERKRVEQAVKGYKGQAVSLVRVDAEAVRPRTNIRLDLTFVEMRQRDTNGFGLSWPESYGAGGALSGSLNLMTGTLSAAYEVLDQAMPSLEAAARYGWAKIRKKAALITVPGRRASFEAGGEVNVTVTGSQAAELRSIPYGARLSVTPRLSKDARTIDLEVTAEISELSETSQNVPGRVISKVDTLVHLGIGQSIMLSGLDSESENVTKEGLPYLSKIPILGLLFGTRHHAEEQSESLIVITPTVLDHPDRLGKKLLDEALVRFEEFDGDFE
jgi:pilus assembly protein CpaC